MSVITATSGDVFIIIIIYFFYNWKLISRSSARIYLRKHKSHEII